MVGRSAETFICYTNPAMTRIPGILPTITSQHFKKTLKPHLIWFYNPIKGNLVITQHLIPGFRQADKKGDWGGYLHSVWTPYDKLNIVSSVELPN